MGVLTPMSPADFTPYLKVAIADFAAQSVASGYWPEEGALERARREFSRLLPGGLSTPNNFLLSIVDPQTRVIVGSLWWTIVDTAGLRIALVFDVHISKQHRRLGFASRALRELLQQIAEMDGLSHVALHVFSFNEGARALYKSLGFEIVSFTLFKRLDLDPSRPLMPAAAPRPETP